jgi:hypothetical protein
MEGIQSKYVGQAESIHPYAENAMSCIVAFECRSRGYDVVSVPYENGNASLQSLMRNAKAAWSDVGGGAPCFIKLRGRTPSEIYYEIRGHVKNGKRYMLEFEWFCQNLRHAVLVIQTDGGRMDVFDPMTGDVKGNAASICGFLAWMKYGEEAGPRLLRIDDLGLNLEIVNDVVRTRGGSDEQSRRRIPRREPG